MKSYVLSGISAVVLTVYSTMAPAGAAGPSTNTIAPSELAGSFAISGPSETYTAIYTGGQLVSNPDKIAEGQVPMLYRVCMSRLTHGTFHVQTKLLKAEGHSCKEWYGGSTELKPKECVDVVGYSVAVGVSDCGNDSCEAEGSYAAVAALPTPPCP